MSLTWWASGRREEGSKTAYTGGHKQAGAQESTLPSLLSQALAPEETCLPAQLRDED